MPRKLGGAGGRSQAPLPIQNSQEDDRPTPPLPAQQNSASGSSAPSSFHTAKGKAKANQLRAQYQAEARKKEAEVWRNRLRREGEIPLTLLCNNVIGSKNRALIQKRKLLDELHAFQGLPTNREHEQKLEEVVKGLGDTLGCLYDEAENYDKFLSPDTLNKAKVCLDEFDALPEGTKAGLARAKEDLFDIVADAKWYLMRYQVEKIGALTICNDIEFEIGSKKLRLLQGRQAVLEEKMCEPDVSAEVLTDAEMMMTEFDRLSIQWKEVTRKQADNVEKCEALLGWKNVKFLDNRDKRNDFIQYAQDRLSIGANQYRDLSFNLVAAGVVENLCLLLLLNEHNNGPQENESLTNWLEFIEPLVSGDFSNAQEGLSALDRLVKKLLGNDASQETPSAKGAAGEALSLLSQLASQSQSQLEKLLRTCETGIKEYEKLEGIVRDERVTLSLKAIAEAITDTIRTHGCIVQCWTSRLQELEDKESFLPPNLRAQQRQSRVQLSLPEDMHETTDGIVVGQINQDGKLERLGKKKEVTGTYFKDDSGRWIKDYGNDPVLEQLTPAAVTGQTAARDNAVKWMEKAGRIAQAALRSSMEGRAMIEAIDASGDDYTTRLDKKIEALNRASSRHSAAINQLADILGDLAVLPVQDQDPKAAVQGHLMRLKEDREGVESLLQQVKNEQHIHARKMRDPTEANFRFLWNEGQVESIKKDFSRRQNRAEGKEKDWLERYTIFIKPGPQGEQYEPWIVHAHFDSNASDAEPICVHMKRDAEKEWGVDQKPYHSLPLNQKTFDLVKKEAQKEEVTKEQAASKKEKGRRRR